MRDLILCLGLVTLTGCASLPGPALDHAAVSRVIADSCRAEGLGKGKCTIDDIEAVAVQAECLAAARRGVTCEDIRR